MDGEARLLPHLRTCRSLKRHTGGFIELMPLLSLLATKYTPSTLPYSVIVPSFPGYVFSSPPPLDRQLYVDAISRVFHKLMLGLGFASGYVAQGKDAGARIARMMSHYDSCKGKHALVLFDLCLRLTLFLSAAHVSTFIFPIPKDLEPQVFSDFDRAAMVRNGVFRVKGTDMPSSMPRNHPRLV